MKRNKIDMSYTTKEIDLFCDTVKKFGNSASEASRAVEVMKKQIKKETESEHPFKKFIPKNK